MKQRNDTNEIGIVWLGLRELTQYAAVSDRTLRTWSHSAIDPLPAVQVGGKILISRRAFDAWLEQHRVSPAGKLDLSGIVEEVLEAVTDGR